MEKNKKYVKYLVYVMILECMLILSLMTQFVQQIEIAKNIGIDNLLAANNGFNDMFLVSSTYNPEIGILVANILGLILGIIAIVMMFIKNKESKKFRIACVLCLSFILFFMPVMYTETSILNYSRTLKNIFNINPLFIFVKNSVY